LVEVTDPELDVTGYAYDSNGNRTVQRSARGKETAYAFDELNRAVSMTYPGGNREEYGYDPNGNRTRLLDARGQETLYHYDELGREVLRTYPGAGVRSIAPTYDANDNLLTTTETLADGGTLVATQTWDTFDRLSSGTNRYGETLVYSYDANGNRQSLRDPDGKVTLYAYDARNRLSSVTVPEAGATNYGYFRNGLLQQVVYPNGTTAAHTYDPANRVQRIENKQGATLVSSYDYAYDPNGNRTRQTEENGGPPETTTYTYDTADRLTGVVYPEKTVAYTLDPVGNRLREVTSEAGTPTSDKLSLFDDRDRLLTITDSLNPANNQTLTYDPNGNLTSRLQAGVLTEYLYDPRDQLSEVRRDGQLVESYAYDHRGLRVRKAGSGSLLRYVYDDTSVLLQTDDFGKTIAKYEWGPDRLLSLDHVTEGRQFYLFDALGSPVDLMKPDGSLAVRYQWDAWGLLRKQTGESFNVFGFTGYERDEDTGLFYAKARFYDPEVGRFLSEDPFEGVFDQPPSLHKYLYVYANPTVYWDHLGLQAEKAQEENLDTAFERLIERPRELKPGEKPPEGWTVLDHDGMRWAVPPKPKQEEQDQPSWWEDAWNWIKQRYTEKITGTVVEARELGVDLNEGLTKPRCGDEESCVEQIPAEKKRQIRGVAQVAEQTEVVVKNAYEAAERVSELLGAKGLVGVVGGIGNRALTAKLAEKAGKEILGDSAEVAARRAALAALRGGLPRGVTFEGVIHRAVKPPYTTGAWRVFEKNIAASHRYSGAGRGGVYAGTSREAVLAELKHYGVDTNDVTLVAANVRVDNVLDLTNPAVRNQLGVTLTDLTSNDYTVTQAIGDLARSRYSAILVPSAREPGAKNLVLLPVQ
jgi:RHS repeat-associated protein